MAVIYNCILLTHMPQWSCLAFFFLMRKTWQGWWLVRKHLLKSLIFNLTHDLWMSAVVSGTRLFKTCKLQCAISIDQNHIDQCVISIDQNYLSSRKRPLPSSDVLQQCWANQSLLPTCINEPWAPMTMLLTHQLSFLGHTHTQHSKKIFMVFIGRT